MQRDTNWSLLDSQLNSSELERKIRDETLHDILSALDLSHACIRGMDGTITFWCLGNERLYGWSRAEALGCIIHTLLKTEFPDSLAGIEAMLLRDGSWTGELLHRTKTGDEVWVASHWVLQRNPDGSARAVIEVNNDVTARRRSDTASRYLASIVESSDDAIVSKDLQGIVTSWNPGAQRLFGYSADEMIGTSILKLFPPELVGEELAIQARLFRGQPIDHYETVRVTKTGRQIAVSLTLSPITDEAGNVIGGSKIARDISERKAMEEAISESEERQRLAMEAGELGLWSYDLTSCRWYWSSRCKEIFGLSPDAEVPIYEEILQLIHPEDSERVDRTFQAAVAEGIPFDMDFRILDRIGGVQWIQSKGRPCLAPGGKVIQVHGTVLDFTRRKQTEDALRRMNSQLQQFAYAAAHDLQEPLRNVALSVQLAQAQANSGLDPEAQSMLDTAARSAIQMIDMVRALLAYSKILHDDERRWPVSNCCEVLEAALEHLAPAIRETSARITHDPLPLVKMDRTQLLQLFQNLIGNALKYHGSGPPEIHIGAILRKSFWQLSVSDNGIGIEPQYQERVFGVFKRLQKTDAAGTGLGLALCKRIVEHYGGEIQVLSDGIKGSKFVFTVPAAEGLERAMHAHTSP